MDNKSNRLAEKINAVKEINSLFSRTFDFDYNELAKNLTIDEILDSRFEDEFLPLLFKQEKFSAKNFINIVSSSSFVNGLKSNLTKEDIIKIIDKFFKIVSNDQMWDAYTVNYISSVWLIYQNSEHEEYVIQKLIKNKMWKTIASNMESIKPMLDSIMVKSSYTYIFNLYNELSVNLPKYNSYPLVILNPNITMDEKIELINKTYKQKDITNYANFIKSNIKDLDHLDAFIEATIIKNARIKEKEKNIFDIMQRIFVGMRGDGYFRAKFDYENQETFFKKYGKYFNPDNANLFLLGFNSYDQNRNARLFISQVYKYTSLESQIELATLNEDMGDSLFENPDHVFNNEIKGDTEKEKKFLKFLLSKRRYDVREKLDNFVYYVNKYPEVFKDYLQNKLCIDSIESWYDSKKEVSAMFDIAISLEPEALKYLKFMSDTRIYNLGASDEIDNSRNSYSKSIDRMYKSYQRILDRIDLLTDKKQKEIMFNLVFSKYMDEDIVNGEMFSSLSSFLRDESNLSEIKKAVNAINDTSMINNLFNNVITIIERNYPEKKEAVENLNRLKQNITLILAL
jgi:hypothetical protein